VNTPWYAWVLFGVLAALLLDSWRVIVGNSWRRAKYGPALRGEVPGDVLAPAVWFTLMLSCLTHWGGT
jgi:hypothetical protein